MGVEDFAEAFVEVEEDAEERCFAVDRVVAAVLEIAAAVDVVDSAVEAAEVDSSHAVVDLVADVAEVEATGDFEAEVAIVMADFVVAEELAGEVSTRETTRLGRKILKRKE